MIDNSYKNTTKDESNGWSKYQIFVLKQLEDHNKLLEKLNERLNDLSNQLNVISNNLLHEKNNVEKIEDQMQSILSQKEALISKVNNLEKSDKIKTEVDIKTKAIWSTIGGVSITLLTIIIQVIQLLLNNK